MKRINRLCLFSFYDTDGIVDEYVIYLLDQLKTISNKLYIAVNGVISKQGYDKIKEYADKIIIRENVGFDAGAYKDLLENHIGWDNLYKYYELILCNNTFFGPFISLKKIFSKMEEKYNFWGLNKIENTIVDHIQSYFLVFDYHIISSGDLNSFFKKYIIEYENDITNVYVEFETGISVYMKNKGYKIGTYGIPNTCDNYRSPNIAMYKYNVPVIKNKLFLDDQSVINNVYDALNYIEKKTDYSVKMIIDYWNRKYDYNFSNKSNKLLTSLQTDEKKFYIRTETDEQVYNEAKKYDRLYIYGAGLIARKIYRFIKLPKIDCFIISDDQKKSLNDLYGIPVKKLSEIDNFNRTGFIIGLNNKNYEKIKDNFKYLKVNLIHI